MSDPGPVPTLTNRLRFQDKVSSLACFGTICQNIRREHPNNHVSFSQGLLNDWVYSLSNLSLPLLKKQKIFLK